MVFSPLEISGRESRETAPSTRVVDRAVSDRCICPVPAKAFGHTSTFLSPFTRDGTLPALPSQSASSMFAKFKPPSLTNVTRPCSSSEKSDSAEQQHPAKRQRLSEPLQKSNLIPSPFPSNRQRTSLIESRKPLLTLRNPAANFVQHAEADGNERTYNVLW